MARVLEATVAHCRAELGLDIIPSSGDVKAKLSGLDGSIVGIKSIGCPSSHLPVAKLLLRPDLQTRIALHRF